MFGRCSADSAPARLGISLVELVIVLAILGIVSLVASTAALRPGAQRHTLTTDSTVTAARRAALSRGRPVVVSLMIDGSLRDALALPNGTVVADTALRVDRLAGRVKP